MIKHTKRYGVNKRRGAKSFRKSVSKTHPRNMAPKPMRGGFRL